MSASSLRYVPTPDQNGGLRARIVALGGGLGDDCQHFIMVRETVPDLSVVSETIYQSFRQAFLCLEARARRCEVARMVQHKG